MTDSNSDPSMGVRLESWRMQLKDSEIHQNHRAWGKRKGIQARVRQSLWRATSRDDYSFKMKDLIKSVGADAELIPASETPLEQIIRSGEWDEWVAHANSLGWSEKMCKKRWHESPDLDEFRESMRVLNPSPRGSRESRWYDDYVGGEEYESWVAIAKTNLHSRGSVAKTLQHSSDRDDFVAKCEERYTELNTRQPLGNRYRRRDLEPWKEELWASEIHQDNLKWGQRLGIIKRVQRFFRRARSVPAYHKAIKKLAKEFEPDTRPVHTCESWLDVVRRTGEWDEWVAYAEARGHSESICRKRANRAKNVEEFRLSMHLLKPRAGITKKLWASEFRKSDEGQSWWRIAESNGWSPDAFRCTFHKQATKEDWLQKCAPRLLEPWESREFVPKNKLAARLKETLRFAEAVEDAASRGWPSNAVRMAFRTSSTEEEFWATFDKFAGPCPDHFLKTWDGSVDSMLGFIDELGYSAPQAPCLISELLDDIVLWLRDQTKTKNLIAALKSHEFVDKVIRREEATSRQLAA